MTDTIAALLPLPPPADDRDFYDPVAHKYTVQKWLDDVNARYGGVDSILLWPTCERCAPDETVILLTPPLHSY